MRKPKAPTTAGRKSFYSGAQMPIKNTNSGQSFTMGGKKRKAIPPTVPDDSAPVPPSGVANLNTAMMAPRRGRPPGSGKG